MTAHDRRDTAASRRCLAADEPAHRQIMAQAFGVVHIFVSGKPPEHGLAQQTDQCVTALPASASIGGGYPRHRAKAEVVVEPTVGEQSGVGVDLGAMELELHAAVEIELESAVDRFTRRVRHDGPMRSKITWQLYSRITFWAPEICASSGECGT